MSGNIHYASAGMGRRVEGRALVASDGFSARYDLDRRLGTFSRPEHKLAGASYVGRVLVLHAAKGGVATAWMLHEMKVRGVVPPVCPVANAAVRRSRSASRRPAMPSRRLSSSTQMKLSCAEPW